MHVVAHHAAALATRMFAHPHFFVLGCFLKLVGLLANSAYPDKSALLRTVRSGSTVLTEVCLSE